MLAYFQHCFSSVAVTNITDKKINQTKGKSFNVSGNQRRSTNIVIIFQEPVTLPLRKQITVHNAILQNFIFYCSESYENLLTLCNKHFLFSDKTVFRIKSLSFVYL